MTSPGRSVLAVDFGTATSSAAAVGREGGVHLLKEPGTGSYSWPSAVAQVGTQLVVGTAAERRKKRSPGAYRAEFKSVLGEDLPIPLDDNTYQVTDLIAALLLAFRRQAAELVGDPPDRLVLTVPASYLPNDPRRELMISAGEAAGFAEVELLTEPVAAAHAPIAGQQLTPGSTVLVYDFGGGTFDAALVKVSDDGVHQVIGSRALDDCGGRDIDAALADNLRQTGGEQMAWVLAPDSADAEPMVTVRMGLLLGDFVRLVKHQLSDVDDVEDYLTPTAPPYEIRRSQLAELIGSQLKATIGCCLDLIRDCGLELSDVGAVLLVGGTSRMPLVTDLVATELGDSLLRPEDPDLAVVQGAAQWAIQRGERAAPPRRPSADSFPLNWDLPGGSGTLLRCDVLAGNRYQPGARLGLVRLSDDTLLNLSAPSEPGTLMSWHARPGDRVVTGDWIVTIGRVLTEGGPDTVGRTSDRQPAAESPSGTDSRQSATKFDPGRGLRQLVDLATRIRAIDAVDNSRLFL